ncbi:major facilitator superfamily domain-containing protein 9-like [Agrilus planipennis]|uniref:Major facilitator superfamily domain-containing protein 9-like n=1 Tax=Agrilus planipennis TaxID=224129 RepID=A0A1W4X9N3_AGRPL|nr:major facilitator superfamily domain-containing protein 9-like [Agrilus planipennis]
MILAGVHFVQVLIKAIAVDIIPEKEQVTVFTNIGALLGVGFTLGPVIGGHLYAAHGDFFYIVVIVNTLYLACLGAVALLPETQTSAKPTKPKSGVIQNIQQINWTLIWDVFLVKMASELAFSFWRSTLIILMREVFDIPTKSLGYFIGYNSVLMVLSNIFMPFIQRNLYPDDQNGTNKLLKLSLLLQGVAFALMAVSKSFSAFVILCTPLIFGKVLLDTVWMKILLNRIKDEDKGVIIGASDSIVPLSGFISPITVGAVVEVSSLGASCYLPLLALAVSVPIINKLGN